MIGLRALAPVCTLWRGLILGLALACFQPMAVRAQPTDTTALQRAQLHAGAASGDMAPAPSQWMNSATRDRQFPLYRTLMTQPLQAPYRTGMLASAYREAASSAHSLFVLTGAVAGLSVARGDTTQQPGPATTNGDALAASMAWMPTLAPAGTPWQPDLPNETALPPPLRLELAHMFTAMGRAEQFRRRAFAQLPPSVTPALLVRQAILGQMQLFEEPDYRRLLPAIEREALQAGMLELVAATERLQQFVKTSAPLPAVSWQLDTPFGRIVVDTTGRDNIHRLQSPLLVLDVGGNDRYEFGPSADRPGATVLIDHGGNDHYTAPEPGTDPSSAVLDYGILWDNEGDDQHHGGQLTQGAALFGAALLVDNGGNNQFHASGYAQAYALGGIAVLHSGSGQDEFTAQTHAQASAGPEGVAVLLDTAGDDHYTLVNTTPLARPSPQLPSHNTSMGQGAGRGVRADFSDGRSTTGGIGMLIDLAGNDHYTAQVFAQGVGYHEGVGLLVDDGGNNHFNAAWYAMGAAAHRSVGVLLNRGTGNDRYHASHSTSIGAAHDFSVAFFLDQGGNDSYRLGDLGLGAAHDNSTALFVDASGDDTYQVDAPTCRALGAAHISQWGTLREDLPNTGLFMDLGGDYIYPPHCGRTSNNTGWASPRFWLQLGLKSEAGAGVDGEYALPFFTGPRTR